MNYTIKKLADLAGITTRTLRYYDQIGLLKPAAIQPSGYRTYTQHEIERLQHILFYRELGLELDHIKKILDDPTFDTITALLDHQEKLRQQRSRLDTLLNNVSQTIEAQKGRTKMSDKQRFEGFKRQLIDENEKNYGKEARKAYGDNAIDQANEQLLNMTEETYNDVFALEEQIKQELKKAMATGDPSGSQAQHTAALHKQWITHHWGTYSAEGHAGLAEMYVADERFKAYYEDIEPGAAGFLRDAIVQFTKES